MSMLADRARPNVIPLRRGPTCTGPLRPTMRTLLTALRCRAVKACCAMSVPARPLRRLEQDPRTVQCNISQSKDGHIFYLATRCYHDKLLDFISSELRKSDDSQQKSRTRLGKVNWQVGIIWVAVKPSDKFASGNDIFETLWNMSPALPACIR